MTNWNEQWNALLQTSRFSDDDECHYANEERVKQYDGSVAIWEDAARRVSDLNPDPSWSVLEMEPGPGVMTIPLANRVASVTVVEPSPAMITILKNHLDEEGIENVSIIHKKWEETEPSELRSYNLVLASYSLDMFDITRCLEKMCSHATDAVHLWWFDGITSWEKIRSELIPKIMGADISVYPKSDLIMQILREKGYSPRHEVLNGTSFPNQYTCYEEACRRMSAVLNLDPDEPLPLPASRFIMDTWKQEDGTYRYEDSTTYVHITIPVRKDQ